MADSGGVHGHTRTAKPLAFRPRIPQTRSHALCNQAALQLGHSTQDGEADVADFVEGAATVRDAARVWEHVDYATRMEYLAEYKNVSFCLFLMAG